MGLAYKRSRAECTQDSYETELKLTMGRQKIGKIPRYLLMNSVQSPQFCEMTSLNSYFTPSNMILQMELFLILPFSLNNCNCREDMDILVVCNEI